MSGRVTFNNAPVGAFYGETSSTTQNKRVSTNIPVGTKSLLINCSGDFRLQLAPPLVLVCKTTDGEATFTDYTSAATDKSTDTDVDLSSLDTAANGDYWYVASRYKFGGVWVDVDGANGNNVTLTGYYNNPEGWTNISLTDGTNSSGTLAVDGAITWAVPSDWRPAKMSDLFPNASLINLSREVQDNSLYVVRFQVSGAVDGAVTLNMIAPLGDIATYPQGYFQADTDYEFNINRDEVGGIEYYETVGSKTLTITYVKEHATDQ